MKYIAVQMEAVDELISDRLLQSTDFDSGIKLATLLSTDDLDIHEFSSRVEIVVGTSKQGRIIFVPGAHSKTFVVFDLESSGLFSDAKSKADNLLYFQRILRFCIKFWQKRVMNSFELVWAQYQKAVIFPHPISQKTSFRITIALNPDADRLSKRGQSEQYLLAYRAGTDDGRGPDELPPVAVFRKFLEDVRTVDFTRVTPPKPAAHITAFQNVSIADPQGRMDIHQGYEKWMRVLTGAQRSFIQSPLQNPIRIEGPAGTGKTLCLALKAIYHLRSSEEEGVDNSTLFVTHSEASRQSILTVIQSMAGDRFLSPSSARQSLKVVTLQSHCASLLHQELSSSELVDPDAYDAKQMQMLYVEEALGVARKEFGTYSKLFSEEFFRFLESSDDVEVIQMLQHEIAVVIKGRAGENYDIYKNIDRIPNGVPLIREGDRAFMWRIFDLYREQLVATGQFDTDDVTLSALGQLTTPIWRRRRRREGFDCIFVDETHLFNMNELSILHHLTKQDDRFKIAFAVDRSQAIGDRGWSKDIDIESLVPDPKMRAGAPRVKVASVFRCSPDIVNLAFSVTSAGASLFTNFEDPLEIANSNLSFEEERICTVPSYTEFPSDEVMVEEAFTYADRMATEMHSTKGDVAIVAFTDHIFQALRDKAERDNKGFEVLKERGNVEVVRRARQSGRFVLALPDYVGGLEFDGVVLVGVDEGRVPPTLSSNSESKAFLSFSAHNRLYVAITRARYRVAILGVKSRGPSPILKSALNSSVLERT